jgi:hypothetical protein
LTNPVDIEEEFNNDRDLKVRVSDPTKRLRERESAFSPRYNPLSINCKAKVGRRWAEFPFLESAPGHFVPGWKMFILRACAFPPSPLCTICIPTSTDIFCASRRRDLYRDSIFVRQPMIK